MRGQRAQAGRLGFDLLDRVLGHGAQCLEVAHQVARAVEAEAFRDLGPSRPSRACSSARSISPRPCRRRSAACRRRRECPSSSTFRSNTPSSESPQRICASKKPSGRPGSTVSIQSATLVSSTAIGLRSTPWMQQRATSRSAWRKSASDGRALGADAGEARGDAAGGGQQEVARAAGGVDDAELQQRLRRDRLPRPRSCRARDRALCRAAPERGCPACSRSRWSCAGCPSARRLRRRRSASCRRRRVGAGVRAGIRRPSPVPRSPSRAS